MGPSKTGYTNVARRAPFITKDGSNGERKKEPKEARQTIPKKVWRISARGKKGRLNNHVRRRKRMGVGASLLPLSTRKGGALGIDAGNAYGRGISRRAILDLKPLFLASV